jgi:hypothetical protein
MSILYGGYLDLERDQPIFEGGIEVTGRLSLFTAGVIWCNLGVKRSQNIGLNEVIPPQVAV